jgi:hypothetical protein
MPDMPSATGDQPAARRRPLVELLTIPGCPNRDAAIALVRRVCEQFGGDAEVRVVEVPDQQAAEQARFLGSPTIRVNGRDIAPGAEQDIEYVHGCRLYQGEYSLRALPDEAWLREALATAEVQR